MSVGGTYIVTVKTPMGDQQGTLTVNPDGDTFTGNISSGMMGSMDIDGGSIDGNTLTWKMKMTSPMPMDLTCTATVDGDAIDGKIDTGAFGAMTISGTRAA
ncbi:MAG: hypothetical protein KDE55_12580 [Novosphingobium sp.]|nr:hypothetical protein [Novosphingobium sp.]